MGNSMKKVDESTRRPYELSALNDAEESSLRRMYGHIFPNGALETAKLGEYFSSETIPEYTQAVSEYLRSHVADVTSFLVTMAKCSRGRADGTFSFFWDICALCGQEMTNRDQLVVFFKLMLEFGKCIVDGIEHSAELLCSHLHHKLGIKTDSDITLRMLMEWGNEYAPNMHRLLATYLNQICFPDVELLSFVPFCPPMPEVPSGIIPQSGLLPLAIYTTSCQGKWKCLYTTARDGISFNRVAHNILGYGGATCILIRSEAGDVFGVFSDMAWKDSNRFYGNSNSFLFSLSPQFRILRANATANGSFQWLNLKSYGLPHGLGVGGTVENFRFYIPDSLEECIVRAECDTFERGRIISSGERFSIRDMEVWGCGGDLAVAEALQAQRADRAIRADLIQKARTVDKAAFVNNSFDQEFLLSKTFSHKVRMARRESDPTLPSAGVVEGEGEAEDVCYS